MPQLNLPTKEASSECSRKEEPEDIKDKKRKEEWLKEKILIEFYNVEEPGAPLKFDYGSAKKPESFLLLHGGKYNLARKVVQHIESCKTPIWDYKPNGEGQMLKYLKGYNSRFQCRQLFE